MNEHLHVHVRCSNLRCRIDCSSGGYKFLRMRSFTYWHKSDSDPRFISISLLETYSISVGVLIGWFFYDTFNRNDNNWRFYLTVVSFIVHDFFNLNAVHLGGGRGVWVCNLRDGTVSNEIFCGDDAGPEVIIKNAKHFWVWFFFSWYQHIHVHTATGKCLLRCVVCIARFYIATNFSLLSIANL